jgi:hypothetical protein
VAVQGPSAATTTESLMVHADTRLLRVALAAQILLGVLWGISMLFFAETIALGDKSGNHIEKIAIEGAAHFMLVFGAILVWRQPTDQARLGLLMMIFLNALWAVTDLVYIPLYSLTAIDFTVKLIVNAALAILLFLGGRRAAIL